MWMSCNSVLGRLLSGTRALGHHLHQTLSTHDVLLWRDFRNTCHGRTCHFQDSLSILFTPFSPHLFTSAHLPSSQTECVGDVDWRRRFWVLHWSSVGVTVGVHGRIRRDVRHCWHCHHNRLWVCPFTFFHQNISLPFFFNSLVLTKPDWEASLRRLLWAR